jgi:hypothetical protein
MTTPFTADQANAIWDVLVEHAGAVEDQREQFVSVQTYSHCAEYRFGGELGFGGKFWSQRWDVTCYSEDQTAERQAIIAATNAALAALRGSA